MSGEWRADHAHADDNGVEEIARREMEMEMEMGMEMEMERLDLNSR